jgi:hypothetical protein
MWGRRNLFKAPVSVSGRHRSPGPGATATSPEWNDSTRNSLISVAFGSTMVS